MPNFAANGRPVPSETIITGRPPLLGAMSAIWEYRELFFFLALRDVKIKYRQAVLGVAWAAIQPLVTMVLFAWLFSQRMNPEAGSQDSKVFYLSALVPWLYFSGAVSGASNSLVGNADMLRKVYFPRLVLPGAAALASLVDLGVGLAVLLVFIAVFGSLSLKLLLWIPLVILLFVASLSVGAFLAAINARYRDVKHTVPFLLQIWLFLSPVIYPITAIPEQFRFFVALNPMVGILGAFRATAIPTSTVDLPSLLVSIGSTVVLGGFALLYFLRTEVELADVI